MNARERSNHLLALLRTEQGAMADFLLALADFDRHKAWRDLGHSTLFSYLRRELRLSAGAAQYRKTAAELVQKFPAVEAALRRGDLCLSSIIEVAKVLAPENVDEVLPRFFGLSRRDAEALAVSMRPVVAPPRREVVTAISSAAAKPPPAAVPAPAATAGPGDLPALFRPAEVPSRAPPLPATADVPSQVAALQPTTFATARDVVQPLDANAARLHVTVSRRLLAKLAAAKDALSHARPGASTEEVIEAGLDLLLQRRDKRMGVVEKPQKNPRPSTTDVVPARVRREVWQRAGGRCEWRLASGETCGSTTRLELDHVTPRALGGASTLENVRLLCRACNQLAARRAFGDAWMDRFAG